MANSPDQFATAATVAAVNAMVVGNKSTISKNVYHIITVIIIIFLVQGVVWCMRYFSIPVEEDYSQYLMQTVANTMINQSLPMLMGLNANVETE